MVLIIQNQIMARNMILICLQVGRSVSFNMTSNNWLWAIKSDQIGIINLQAARAVIVAALHLAHF